MKPNFDLNEAHRWFAIEYNNAAWDIIESTEPSEEKIGQLLHVAHASYLHWSEVGGEDTRARALCLLAHAYLCAKDGVRAGCYGDEAQELMNGKNSELVAFDRAAIYVALARAAKLRGEEETASQYRKKTDEAASHLTDDGDREVLQLMIGDSWHGIS